MEVTFRNCNSEAARWSFSVKLSEVVRLALNSEGNGMTPLWRQKVKVVLQARNEQIEIARLGGHWNPRIPDHVFNGVINYPSGLDQENEGSRGSFLFGLEHKLSLAGKDMDDPDMEAVQIAIRQAKIDAINGTFHNPTLEDIT